MPWQEVSMMDRRREFVMLASREGTNVSAICRRYGISRQTGYKWLGRSACGAADFPDRSRGPLTQPKRTPAAVGRASAMAARVASRVASSPSKKSSVTCQFSGRTNRTGQPSSSASIRCTGSTHSRR